MGGWHAFGDDIVSRRRQALLLQNLSDIAYWDATYIRSLVVILFVGRYCICWSRLCSILNHTVLFSHTWSPHLHVPHQLNPFVVAHTPYGYRLIGAKPLPEPMLAYRGPLGAISNEVWTKIWKLSVPKYEFENAICKIGDHFALSTVYHITMTS